MTLIIMNIYRDNAVAQLIYNEHNQDCCITGLYDLHIVQNKDGSTFFASRSKQRWHNPHAYCI